MIDLKAAYGDTYRIVTDESAEIQGQTTDERLWLYQIPCKYGHIYVHGKETLGAYSPTYGDSSDRLGRLLAIPGAKLHQRGDREASVTFPPEAIGAVAGILQAKRRVKLSEEHKRKLWLAGSSHRFSPGSNARK